MAEEIEKTMGDINVAEKLNSILDWVEETAKQAGGFVVEQTPLYIQELLAWNFWYSLIWFGAGIGFLIIFAGCLRAAIKGDSKFWDDGEVMPKCIPTLILGLPSLFLGPILTSNNLEWLQISVAPRVWLVEYVASKLN